MYKLVLKNCMELNVDDGKGNTIYLSVKNNKLTTTVEEITPVIETLIKNNSVYAVPCKKSSNQQNVLPPKQTKTTTPVNNKWEEINKQKETQPKVEKPVEQPKVEKPVEAKKEDKKNDKKENKKEVENNENLLDKE